MLSCAVFPDILFPLADNMIFRKSRLSIMHIVRSVSYRELYDIASEVGKNEHVYNQKELYFLFP